jgi:hypothetical protein
VSPELTQATSIEGFSSDETTQGAAPVTTPRMVIDNEGSLRQYRNVNANQIV